MTENKSFINRMQGIRESILPMSLNTRLPLTSIDGKSLFPNEHHKFLKNIATGKSKLMSIMCDKNTTELQKRNAYDNYYGPGPNVDYVKNHPRKLPQKEPLYVIRDVLKYLKKKNAEVRQPGIEPWDVPIRESVNYTLSDAIEIMEKEWDVTIKSSWSILGWWFGFHKLKIYENQAELGNMWVNKEFRKNDIVITIPDDEIGSIVIAPYTEKLLHGMTHAIQNTFTPFWDSDRENDQVLSLYIEKNMEQGTAMRLFHEY